MKFTIIWELGGGLGHLGRQIPLAIKLQQRGHEVQFFVPQQYVDHAWLQPFERHPNPPFHPSLKGRIEIPNSFQDVLWNIGFREKSWLAETVNQWRTLATNQNPNLIVLDYSPVALLSLSQLAFPLAFVCSGFELPVSAEALIAINDYPDRIAKTERDVLKNINAVVGDEKQLQSVIDIFSRLDFKALTTYSELDHFGPRPDVDYWGTWSLGGGKRIEWTERDCLKVFIYVESEVAIGHCLDALMTESCHVLMYCSTEVAERVRRRIDAADFNPAQFRLDLADQPLEIDFLSDGCDFAITHSGHNTTAQILLHGIPLLLLPKLGEQLLVGKRVEQMGAGLMATANDSVGIRNGIRRLSSESGFRESARQFSNSYRDWHGEPRLEAVVDRLEQLASGN